MARNGGGVYSLPAIYEATTGETATAEQHNTPLEDLEQDANTARPIVAGGTGGTTEQAALTNLFDNSAYVRDSKFILADADDTARKLRLDLANITAGNTRVLTMADEDVDLGDVVSNINAVLPGYLYGLTLYHATDTDHDIQVGAGTAASDDVDPVLMRLPFPITKRFDAEFAEGHNSGGMRAGNSLPANGTIHIFLIMKADGTTDVIACNHATAGIDPPPPGDFIYKRRIGSLRTDASANIYGFIQTGDRFIYKSPILDVSSSSQATTPSLRSLSIPHGLKMSAILSTLSFASFAGFAVYRDPDSTGKTASNSNFDVYTDANEYRSERMEVITNTSGQISTSLNATGGTMSIINIGYIDTRGRLG